MSLEGLTRQFDALNAQIETVSDRYAAIQDIVERLEARANRPTRPADEDRTLGKESAALSAFARTGIEFRASLSVGSDPAGGYTETPALSDQIFSKLHDSAPLLRAVRVVEMGSGSSWQEPTDTSDSDALWVGESEERAETSAGEFGLVDIPLHEATAKVKGTKRLFDDSRFDLASYIIDKVSARFGRLTDEAIVSGSGHKSPKGYLTYATSTAGDGSRAAQTFQYVGTGSASAITADSLLNLLYSLRAPYRASSAFVMSSDTARRVRLLKDEQSQYLWAPGLAAGAPDTLLGRPVIYDENMPAVAGGSFPICVADWKRAYTLVRRGGVEWLRDPYSEKPHILLYATMRVGGQASGDFDAMKILKVEA